MKKTIAIFILIMIAKTNFAQTISVTGNWSPSVTTLTTAGAEYSSSNITSLANQSNVTINATGSQSWIVKVSKIDSDWNPSLTLWIRKTGDGAGNGSISPIGATTFTQLTAIDQEIFRGTRKRDTPVPIEYEIRGVSVLVPAKAYSTTIMYTITGF